jgi:hypothetical protein
MSLQDLIDAAAASTALNTRISDFMDTSDAALATMQAKVDNVVETIRDELFWPINVDPDVAMETPVRGGTVATIAAAFNAAPRNSELVINLADGKTHSVEENLFMRGRRVQFIGDIANRPTVLMGAFSNGAFNRTRQFVWSVGCAVYVLDVNFEQAPKADPALPWQDGWVWFQGGLGAQWPVSLYRAGVLGPPEIGFAACDLGSIVKLSMFGVSITDMKMVRNTNAGVALISQWSVTTNTVLFDGGGANSQPVVINAI